MSQYKLIAFDMDGTLLDSDKKIRQDSIDMIHAAADAGKIVCLSTGRCMAILYAILASVALPLETVMLPLYAADLFGSRNFDRIMGLFISVNTAGYALGTPLVNLGYDLTGSYKTVLLLTALIMLLVTIGIQFVISAAHRLRNHF